MRTRLTKTNGNDVLVLLSGGIDSSACVRFYLSQRSNLRALFIDYGQQSAKQEAEAANKISQHYCIPLRVMSSVGTTGKSSGVVLGRNAFLLYFALMEFCSHVGIIAIGIHAGTSYFDCSKAFIDSTQTVFDAYAGGQIQIGAPFLDWTKREVWDYCLQQNVPLEKTYSCELGRNQPCGECLSCIDLEKLRACA